MERSAQGTVRVGKIHHPSPLMLDEGRSEKHLGKLWEGNSKYILSHNSSTQVFIFSACQTHFVLHRRLVHFRESHHFLHLVHHLWVSRELFKVVTAIGLHSLVLWGCAYRARASCKVRIGRKLASAMAPIKSTPYGSNTLVFVPMKICHIKPSGC